MVDVITLLVVGGVVYYLFTTGTIDNIAKGLTQGAGGTPPAGGAPASTSGYSSQRSAYKTSTTGKGGGYSKTKNGKPYCGYGGGCCGTPANGGNCPSTLNYADLGSNNPCPGYYSDPKGGRHHCCPDKPPFNGGTTCTIS